MSLTRLISSNQAFKDNFIKHVPAAKEMKKMFKSVLSDSVAYAKNIPMISAPQVGAFAPNVGTAYDYWLRLLLQKKKGEFLEEHFKQSSAYVGARHLAIDGHISEKKGIDYLGKVISIYNRRKSYVEGKYEYPLEMQVSDAVQLTHFNNYYRSGVPLTRSYTDLNQNEINDCLNIANNTMNSRLFEEIKELHCNPTFGDNSQFVGGADADFILNKTLYDIKTIKEISYVRNDIFQIIGYYLLSEYPPKAFEKERYYDIERIGFYFPRFDHAITIEIEELKNAMTDYETFVNTFFQKSS